MPKRFSSHSAACQHTSKSNKNVRVVAKFNAVARAALPPNNFQQRASYCTVRIDCHCFVSTVRSVSRINQVQARGSSWRGVACVCSLVRASYKQTTTIIRRGAQCQAGTRLPASEKRAQQARQTRVSSHTPTRKEPQQCFWLET